MSISIIKADNYLPETIQESVTNGFNYLGMYDSFKSYIKPGNVVFIKPNWCISRNRRSCLGKYIFTLITHPNVIREIVSRVDDALDGSGEIIVGDCPTIDADWNELMFIQNLYDLKDKTKTKLSFVDLRNMVCKNLKHYGKKDKMDIQVGDVNGQVLFNLGETSMFYNIDNMYSKRLHGIFDSDKDETIRNHSGMSQWYSISSTIFNSDVFISIPKLKTHHKAGVTLNLKGLVGTVLNKNLLPHWTDGFPAIGGDAYPDFKTWFKYLFKRVKKRGAWIGNDTIWRMVVDLYNIFRNLYKGKMFTVIDGVVGGEGNGPFCAEPKGSNVIIMGDSFLEADIVSTEMMGFRIKCVKYLYYFIKTGIVDRKKIDIYNEVYPGFLNFKTPDGWERMRK